MHSAYQEFIEEMLISIPVAVERLLIMQIEDRGDNARGDPEVTQLADSESKEGFVLGIDLATERTERTLQKSAGSSMNFVHRRDSTSG